MAQKVDHRQPSRSARASYSIPCLWLHLGGGDCLLAWRDGPYGLGKPASSDAHPCKKRKGGAPSVCALPTKRGAQLDPSMEMKKRLSRSDNEKETRIAAFRKRLTKAQQMIREHVTPRTSLVDELIAERREAARHE